MHKKKKSIVRCVRISMIFHEFTFSILFWTTWSRKRNSQTRKSRAKGKFFVLFCLFAKKFFPCVFRLFCAYKETFPFFLFLWPTMPHKYSLPEGKFYWDEKRMKMNTYHKISCFFAKKLWHLKVSHLCTGLIQSFWKKSKEFPILTKLFFDGCKKKYRHILGNKSSASPKEKKSIFLFYFSFFPWHCFFFLVWQEVESHFLPLVLGGF